MCPRPVNIDLSGTDVPARLTYLREQRHRTKSELALLAQVSYRTVHELESGRRDRIQEKTLLLLAEALGVQPDELIGHAPLPGPRPQAGNSLGRRHILMQPWPTAVMLLMIAVAAGAVVWIVGAESAVWTIENGALQVRHGVLGYDLWRYAAPGTVVGCEVSPWSPRVLLVCIQGAHPKANPMLALSRRSGRVLWSVVPDLDQLVQAFGLQIMEAGSMFPAGFAVADLYGEGRPLIVVHFRQSVYYPTSLCVVDRQGNRLAQYNSKGYIYEMLVADLDGDGKDSVLAVGTNNDPAYQGATVILLDGSHFRGATTDAVATPASTMPDSARYRLVLPQYPEPYMKLLGLNRLNATRPQLLNYDGGKLGISIDVGDTENLRLIVFLDAELNPLRADAADVFLTRMDQIFPAALQGTGPADPAWRQEWLATHVRFEAGHWPAIDPIVQATFSTE